jgi:hypothetical protein
LRLLSAGFFYSACSQPGQLLFEEAPLGARMDEFERPLIGGPRVLDPVQSAQQLGASCVQVVVAVQLEALHQG